MGCGASTLTIQQLASSPDGQRLIREIIAETVKEVNVAHVPPPANNTPLVSNTPLKASHNPAPSAVVAVSVSDAATTPVKPPKPQAANSGPLKPKPKQAPSASALVPKPVEVKDDATLAVALTVGEAVDGAVGKVQAVAGAVAIGKEILSNIDSEKVASAVTKGLDFLSKVADVLTPLAEIAKVAPFVGPVAVAAGLLLKQLQAAKASEDNCKKLNQIVGMIAHILAKAVQNERIKDGSPIIRTLSVQLTGATKKIQDFSGSRFIKKLFTAGENKKVFEAIGVDLMQTVQLLTAEAAVDTGNAVNEVMDAVRSGAFFSSAESAEETKKRQALEEEIKAAGGIDNLMADEEKLKNAINKLAPGEQMILAELQKGVYTSIKHDELRMLWKDKVGREKETIETVTFLRILKEYFENFEKYQGITGVPAGIQLYGDVIELLNKQEHRDKLSYRLDENGDKTISISEVTSVFKNSDVPLGECVKEIIREKGWTNLPDVVGPSNQHIPRPQYEGSVTKYGKRTAPESIVISGPKGCGKSLVAISAGRLILDSGEYTRGVRYLDASTRSSAEALIRDLSNLLPINQGVLTKWKDLRKHILKSLNDPVCLIIDGPDRAIEKDEEATLEIFNEIRDQCDTIKLILVVDTDTEPKVLGEKVEVVSVPQPSVDEAREWMLELIPQTQFPDREDFVNAILESKESLSSAKEVILMLNRVREVLESGGSAEDLRGEGEEDLVERSIRKLDDDARVAFYKLAVFPGAFSKEMAENVAGVSETDLENMAKTGLLDDEGDGNYMMSYSIECNVRERVDAIRPIEEASYEFIIQVFRQLYIKSLDYERTLSSAAIQYLDDEDHNIDRAIDMLASGRYLDKSEVMEEFADLLDASLDYFLLRQPTTRLIELLEKAAPFGDTDDQSRLNLHRATALSMTRQFDEALVLAHRVEKVFTEAEDAVRTSKVLSVVAQIQISTSEYKKCLDAVERRKKAYQLLAKEPSIGPENGKTADLLVELAEAYAEVAKHDLAAQCLRRALAIYKKHTKKVGCRHRNVARALNLLGNEFRILGHPQEALKRHKVALSIAVEAFGEESAHAATSRRYIALALSQMGEHLAAKYQLEKAIDVYESTIGDENVELFDLSKLVAKEYMALGGDAINDSIDRWVSAFNLAKDLFGDKHRSTLLVGTEAMRACLLYMKSYNIREGKGDDGDNSAVTELIEAEHGFNPGVVFGGMMGGFTALESHTHAEFIELVSLLACVLRDMGVASAMMEGFDDLPKQQMDEGSKIAAAKTQDIIAFLKTAGGNQKGALEALESALKMKREALRSHAETAETVARIGLLKCNMKDESDFVDGLKYLASFYKFDKAMARATTDDGIFYRAETDLEGIAEAKPEGADDYDEDDSDADEGEELRPFTLPREPDRHQFEEPDDRTRVPDKAKIPRICWRLATRHPEQVRGVLAKLEGQLEGLEPRALSLTARIKSAVVILSQACFIKVAPYDKLVEEVDEAIQLLAEYSEAEPGVDRHPEAWLQEARLEGIKTLAKCRKSANKADEALELYTSNTATRLQPAWNQVVLLHERVRLLLELDRVEEAEAVANEAFAKADEFSKSGAAPGEGIKFDADKLTGLALLSQALCLHKKIEKAQEAKEGEKGDGEESETEEDDVYKPAREILDKAKESFGKSAFVDSLDDLSTMALELEEEVAYEEDFWDSDSESDDEEEDEEGDGVGDAEEGAAAGEDGDGEEEEAEEEEKE